MAKSGCGRVPRDPKGPPVPAGLSRIGTGPAGLHQVVNGSFTARLYLLAAPTGETIAIEVIDHAGGETLDELTEVVTSMEFDG